MQTTARVLVRSLVLFAVLATYSIASSRLQGADAAQADIGGGFVMFGLVILLAAVWAGLDARRTTASRGAAAWAAVWALTGVALAVWVNLTIVVRQGEQPVVDVVTLGVFIAVVVATPAILVATLLARDPSAPTVR